MVSDGSKYMQIASAVGMKGKVASVSCTAPYDLGANRLGAYETYPEFSTSTTHTTERSSTVLLDFHSFLFGGRVD